MEAQRQYGTMAWLKPGGLDRESLDVFAMTPPDVRLVVFTSTASVSMMEEADFDAAGFDRDQRPGIVQSVRGMVAYSHPAYISVTGDLIQSAMGVAWDRALRDEIGAMSGGVGATAMTAVTDCLEFLGARRIAVVTPFREQQNAYIRRYLTDAGYELAAIDGYPTHSLREVRALPEDAALTLGRRLYEADPHIDAMYVSCPVWPVIPLVERLEDACGIPVLAVQNTMIWAGLHALGHPGGVHGFGSLVEHPLERTAVAAR